MTRIIACWNPEIPASVSSSFDQSQREFERHVMQMDIVWDKREELPYGHLNMKIGVYSRYSLSTIASRATATVPYPLGTTFVAPGS